MELINIMVLEWMMPISNDVLSNYTSVFNLWMNIFGVTENLVINYLIKDVTLACSIHGLYKPTIG